MRDGSCDLGSCDLGSCDFLRCSLCSLCSLPYLPRWFSGPYLNFVPWPIQLESCRCTRCTTPHSLDHPATPRSLARQSPADMSNTRMISSTLPLKTSTPSSTPFAAGFLSIHIPYINRTIYI
ncbi:hypothetical protein BB8028_0003g15920 [Beauveria bassiana]|uniref:Uncharacterized protein n=1 Tax=Beauveria bassiana TaxID=176275 RepID=A0A2S7YA38_BEABA|nr:hypothetical protein BB8028_0003g15920 [Beauveria bassiana]